MSLTENHLTYIRDFYDKADNAPTWASKGYTALLAHYFNLLIPPSAKVLEVGCGSGELLSRLNGRKKVGVDLSANQIAAAKLRLPNVEFHVQAGETLEIEGTFDAIVISDTINFAADVQQLFVRLRRFAHPDTRLLLNFQSNLWRPCLSVARQLGLTRAHPQSSWLASTDVINLLKLADWDPILIDSRLLLPIRLAGIETIFNRWVAPLPLIRSLCLTVFCCARPPQPTPQANRRVSVIIPARNESGNIAAAVARTPEMGAGTELIFVEGNSTDDTWNEIQRVAAANPHRRIKTMQQKGRGKGDAVRVGFAAATGDILMILDADLTMPPEELPKFHEVLADGQADFANGCRLVYPMDEKAMQFLNLCANKTFGVIFTWLLGQQIKDTLCGTKVLSRRHYDQIAFNRSYFGEFDPFGDFDLLFGAAKLNLKIVDVPIRYRERTYGTTNIQRWKHGWLLLRMVMFAARKLKFV
jgi:SAM-dependent methyltransferase